MRIALRYMVLFASFLGIAGMPQQAFAQWDLERVEGSQFGISTQTPTVILTNIINYALSILGLLGVLGFIIAGMMYLLSGGSEDQVERAKRYMVNSIIGLIVALLGYVVMAAISTLLGAGGADSGL